VRLYASFHSSDRCPIRLQCSVARIATASGPSGWPPTGVDAAVPASAADAAASPGPGALPVSSVASIPLLGRGLHVAVHVHSMEETAVKSGDVWTARRSLPIPLAVLQGLRRTG